MSMAISWVEQGYIPDAVVRRGIRRLCEQRLATIEASDVEASARLTEAFVARMDRSPIALVPELANAQHYEVPAEFFARVLGPHRKYSCAWWPEGGSDLAAAEAASLEATCERAGLDDGQQILELGCGWGSLTLYMAARHPRSQVTAVSNSHSQRAYIEGEAKRRGLANVRVLTKDINHFDAGGRFDRVVSVEMFEHLRNWRAMFGRVASWLETDGRFFMHVFCHRLVPYPFEDAGDDDWMSRHFFTGGIMPSDDLALRFQSDLRLLSRWRWNGTHYARTADAWLANMDANREALWPVLESTYGSSDAELWWNRWRMFFMACAELFGFRSGQEWWVGHYLFARR